MVVVGDDTEEPDGEEVKEEVDPVDLNEGVEGVIGTLWSTPLSTGELILLSVI